MQNGYKAYMGLSLKCHVVMMCVKPYRLQLDTCWRYNWCSFWKRCIRRLFLFGTRTIQLSTLGDGKLRGYCGGPNTTILGCIHNKVVSHEYTKCYIPLQSTEHDIVGARWNFDETVGHDCMVPNQGMCLLGQAVCGLAVKAWLMSLPDWVSKAITRTRAKG